MGDKQKSKQQHYWRRDVRSRWTRAHEVAHGQLSLWVDATDPTDEGSKSTLLQELTRERDEFFNSSLAENPQEVEKFLGYIYLKLEYLYTPQGAAPEAAQPRSPAPPTNAKFLLYLFLEKKDREIIIGDLVEDYGNIHREFGHRRANIWFYKQTASSILPLLKRFVTRVGGLIVIGEWIRKLTH